MPPRYYKYYKERLKIGLIITLVIMALYGLWSLVEMVFDLLGEII